MEIDLRRYFGRRPRVLIGHPIMARGGSEARVMWLVKALKDDCEVTVATTCGWDLESLNRHYGTDLRPDDVTVRYAPYSGPLGNVTAAALRGGLYERFARRIAPEYDIRISAYNITDFGLPAIQFMADFSGDAACRTAWHPPTPGFFYKPTSFRRIYLAAAKALSPPSGRRVFTEDRIVANSCFTATLLRDLYNASPSVVYPPVCAKFPDVPWTEKEDSFVMLGRIAPEKRIERAVAIVDSLRSRGRNLRLRLCGRVRDDSYGAKIRALCSRFGDWVVAEGEVAGERKRKILASCRYGIDACEGEAFGISVAEMVKAGAIVFAPTKGGPAEILDDSRLTFGSDAEAVEKIEAVLLDPGTQKKLRTHLATRGARFSPNRFITQSRSEIAASLGIVLAEAR